MSVFFIKGLDCGRIIDQCHNHISIIGSVLLLHENLVTVEDTRVYHTVAFYLQHEAFAVRHVFCRNRKIVFNIFLSQDRLSGRHGTDQRYIDHFPAGKLKSIVYNLNGPRLGRIPAYVSVFFQSLQMGVNRRSRFQMDCFTDIPHSRGITFM